MYLVWRAWPVSRSELCLNDISRYVPKKCNDQKRGLFFQIYPLKLKVMDR